jgi:hypothetical protein
MVSPLLCSKLDENDLVKGKLKLDLTLDGDSFDQLKKKFVGLGPPTKEMWEFVMPETFNSDIVLGERETMTKLKNLLQEDRVKNALGEDYHSWALLALEKALNPQEIILRFEFPSAASGSRLDLIAER